MKFCYACGHTTGGEPLFCNSCGRSYDVKLCPKLHVNPRIAEACSQCGSRDLSIPQAKIPVPWTLLAVLAQVVSGILVLCFSAPILAAFFADLSLGSATNDRLFIGMFAVIVLCSLWVILPDVSRRIIHRSLIRKSGLTRNHKHP
jgi:hypothetical protein